MQFLWKYVDDLVGKGLELHIIAQLMFYASANLVPMALPLAILLASIMTFGNLGEHYELVALKSSGISLQRIMYPLVIVAMLTSVAAFYFSNNIWPVANLKMKSLLYDVTNKKPALEIKEKVFYKGIDGYVIRIGEKEKDGQTIHDITIYDHKKDKGNVKVMKAEHGKMQMSADERYLIITLKNGRSYEELDSDNRTKDNFPLFRSKFKEDVIRFDLSDFAFMRTDEGLFKDHHQMLNLSQLEASIDTMHMKAKKRKGDLAKHLYNKMLPLRDTLTIPKPMGNNDSGSDWFNQFSKADKLKIIESSMNMTRNTRHYVSALGNEFESKRKSIARHEIEWHRKFTLSIACIVLFFIGAPLGAIIRKGGLGLPVVVSIIFFLIFHVLSIIGEKLITQGAIEPYFGMWIATACLSPIGIFLTYKATTDSALLQAESYTRFFKSIIGLFKMKSTVSAAN